MAQGALDKRPGVGWLGQARARVRRPDRRDAGLAGVAAVGLPVVLGLIADRLLVGV